VRPISLTAILHHLVTIVWAFSCGSMARHHLWHRRPQDRYAFQPGRAEDLLAGAGPDKLSVIPPTVILCGLLYLFFTATTLAPRLRASSENISPRYYMLFLSSAWCRSCGGFSLRSRPPQRSAFAITFVHSNADWCLG